MFRRSWLVLSLVSAAAVAGCSSTAAEASKVIASAQSTAPAAANPSAAPTDPGSPWTVVVESPGVGPIYTAGFLNPTFGMSVGTGGEIHVTTDGGKTWPQATNESLCRYGVDIVDEKVAWHCGNTGIGMSADGGKTWQVRELDMPEPDQCKFLSFVDATTGWAGNPIGLRATTDAGSSWVPVDVPAEALEQGLSAVQLLTAAEGYVLDRSGVIWTTADAGKTWKSVSLGLPSDQLIDTGDAAVAAMRFTDATHGLVIVKAVVGENPPAIVALRTADGAKTWKAEQVTLDARFVQGLYLSRDATTLTAYSGNHGISVFSYKG